MAKKKPISAENSQLSPAEPKALEAKRHTETPPNLPTIYANGFQIAVGPMDVRLFFLETIPLSPSEVVDKRLVGVIMAPEAFKLLSDNLHNFVEIYEKQFGKIRAVTITGQPVAVTTTPLQKTGEGSSGPTI